MSSTDPAHRLGVDLGGTKIEAAVMTADGAIGERRRTPTPHDYDGLVRAVAELATAVATPATPLGIGIPGSPSPSTGLVRGANTTFLNGRDLGKDLAAATGRRVRVANDADCFALSEATDGAAAGAEVAFGVIIGTGCGGGVVVNGALVPGAGGIAGEWGHTPLPWASGEEHPGPMCWCGRRGCMEQWVSGPAFARDGGAPSEELGERAAAGEPQAVAALQRYVSRLARGLAVVCDIVDPAVIVLGGGMSNLDALYPAVERGMGPHTFTDAPVAKVVRNRWGDSSGVRGAAWLWPQPNA